MTDKELVEAVLQKNELACNELYQRLLTCIKPLVGKILYRYPEEQEDQLIVIISHIFSKLHQFEFKSSLNTWCYRVGFNQCLMWLRWRKNHVELDALSISNYINEDDGYSTRFDIEDERRQFEELNAILDLEKISQLKSISPRAWQYTVDKYVLGLTMQEIADKNGVAIGTVKSNTCRFIKQLQDPITNKNIKAKLKNI